MKIYVMVFVKTTPEGDIERICACSQGVDYFPVDVSTVNGERKFTFQIEGDEDTTPALIVAVSDGIGIKERVGG